MLFRELDSADTFASLRGPADWTGLIESAGTESDGGGDTSTPSPKVDTTDYAVPFRPGNWRIPAGYPGVPAEYIIAADDTPYGLAFTYLNAGSRVGEIRSMQTHQDSETSPIWPGAHYVNRYTLMTTWAPGKVCVMPMEATERAKELLAQGAPQGGTSPQAQRPASTTPQGTKPLSQGGSPTPTAEEKHTATTSLLMKFAAGAAAGFAAYKLAGG